MKSLLPLALVTLLTAPAIAGDTEPKRAADRATNIHFTLTMLDTDATGNASEQVVETLAVSDRSARTHAGWRVSIPVVSVHSTDGQDMPTTSYQYQDVGLALELQGRTTPQDTVLASGKVELTGVEGPAVAPATGAPAPQIGTFNHRFEATLLDGVPTTLVSVPKPDGGSVRLTLTATIQR